MSLNLICLPAPHTAALLDGTASVPGVEYAATQGRSADNCTRRMLAGEFDAGEMSIATYFKARSDRDDLIALPIFTSRRLLHAYVYCAEGAPFTSLTDLAGRRATVPQFWMTSSVWHRYLLGHYGVDFRAVTWLPLLGERLDGMGDPPGTTVDRRHEGQEFEKLLADGASDVHFTARNEPQPGIRRLFADPEAEGQRYVQGGGVTPVMHVVAARTALLREQPEVAEQVTRLFEAARDRAAASPPFELSWAANEQGVRAFHATACDQRLITPDRPIEAYFHGLDR